MIDLHRGQRRNRELDLDHISNTLSSISFSDKECRNMEYKTKL